MKADTKTIVAIAVVIFVLLTGLRFLTSFHTPAPPLQATSPFGSLPPHFNPSLPPANAESADPKINDIMTKYHLGLKAANYIAQARVQILSQTDTSVHFAIAYPDKATTDVTITVAADPNYAASPADLERAVRTGSRVHGPKLTFKRNGPKEWQYTLQYHVPYSAMSADLLQILQIPSNSQRSSTSFLDLVPSVHADGGLAAGEGAVSVVANYSAAYYDEMWEMHGRAVGVDVPLALADLGDDLLTLRNWMNEIGELEDCARNPTNPLSQEATHDSNYQHDVLDPLSDARGDVASTLVPTLASDTAGFLTHWLPFGSGALAGLVFSTQDEAISQYAEGRIEEARRYVVHCDVAMTPGDLRPMEGALTYTYISNQPAGTTDKRNAEGKFELNIVQGGLAGEGTAKFTRDYVSASTNPQCRGIGESIKAKGDLKIAAQGGGTPSGGVIELRLRGDLPVVDAQLVGNGANNCVEQTKNYAESYGLVCHFDHLDMVHGGTFSTLQHNDGHGTCTIELSRK